MKKYYLFIGVLFITGFGLTYSQVKLKGIVTNSDDKPLADVMVYTDTTFTNVVTNKEGAFEIDLPEKVNFIHVYSHEYGLLSANYNNQNIINFMYLVKKLPKKERTSKKDKIAIGYSEIEKKHLVTSVQTIDAKKENNLLFYRDIYDMIRGRVPGVTVTKDNRIIIRGINSVRNTSDPLFVVDGSIVSSIDYLLPNNVEDITVLKDSEASIYGAQGASGVIKITTKTKN